MIGALTAGIIVTGIGACIVTELQETPESGGVPPKMRIIYSNPGAIAWDGCDCGQLALTVQSDYPTQSFPIDASEVPVVGGCGPFALAYEVLVSLVRCVPGLDAQARPPTPAKLLEASLIQLADAFAVRNAVTCCLAELKRTYVVAKYTVGRVNFVGPEGNCGGIELIFRFELT